MLNTNKEPVNFLLNTIIPIVNPNLKSIKIDTIYRCFNLVVLTKIVRILYYWSSQYGRNLGDIFISENT